MDFALEALLGSAQNDWERRSAQEKAEMEEEYERLPICPVHDFDWSYARDMLLS